MLHSLFSPGPRALSPAAKFGVRFVCLSLIYLSGTALASASISYPQPIVARVKVASVGYRLPWCQSLRQSAERASRDKAPYLANRLWRLLVWAGDREAAFRLGLYYDTNGTSEQKARRAVYWYRRAALAGEIHAEHNLGVAYADGKGVKMNILLAIKWWTRAARRGNADSQYNLGILYTAGEYGIKRNIALAKSWWRAAALHGDGMAQYNLGTLYVNGKVQDYCAASHWWREAAERGVQLARLALRVIKTRKGYRVCQ